MGEVVKRMFMLVMDDDKKLRIPNRLKRIMGLLEGEEIAFYRNAEGKYFMQKKREYDSSAECEFACGFSQKDRFIFTDKALPDELADKIIPLGTMAVKVVHDTLEVITYEQLRIYRGGEYPSDEILVIKKEISEEREKPTVFGKLEQMERTDRRIALLWQEIESDMLEIEEKYKIPENEIDKCMLNYELMMMRIAENFSTI